jgi:ATPase subunit of ABC transporter with duplicated ATPase domains
MEDQLMAKKLKKAEQLKAEQLKKTKELKTKELKSEQLKVKQLKKEENNIKKAENNIKKEKNMQHTMTAEQLKIEKIKKIIIEIDLQIRNNKKFDGRDPLSFKCDIENISLEQIYNICQEDIILLEKLQLVCNNKTKFINFIKIINDRYSNLLIVYSDNKISVKNLTPYQERNDKNVFGYFRCNKCRKNWTSAASWKNKWQQCKKCESMIYPYNQHPLEKSDNSIKKCKSPHDQSRCEKCVELKTLCCPTMYY